MKKFRITKKVVAFVLSILLIFSTASVAMVEPLAVGEHQHQFDPKWEIAVKATCVQVGTRYRECKVDGCTYRVYESIPTDINNHNYQQTEVKIQATCKVMGVESYTCLWCGAESVKYVEKLAHTFDEDKWQITTKAKCNKPGREKNDCTACGARVSREYTVEHEVDYSKILATVAPTCKTKGVNCYDCKNCTDLVKEEIEVNANNHVFTENPHNIIGLTCKTDGVGTVICKECGKEKTVTVSKDKAHSYLEWTVKPGSELPAGADCTSSGVVGVRVRYCSVCKLNVDSEVFYPQHKLTSGYSTRLATCMKTGYNRGDCIVCMETGVDVVLPIDKDAHLWKEVVLEEATCAKEGRLLKICTLNDSHVEIVDIPKLEHKVTGPWLVVEPNCTEEGFRYNECVECDGPVWEIIPVNSSAHVFADDVQWVQDPDHKPTCDKEGKEVAMCQKCLKIISRPVPKHYNDRIVYSYKAPTCFTEGLIEYACKKCSSGQVRSEVIPVDPNAHVKSTRKATVILPTCYSAGLYAYDCVYCDYIFTGEDDDPTVLETTAHTMSDWEVTERPTCEKDGIKTRKCVNEDCNHTESRVMAASHNFTTWKTVVEATCKQYGTRERVCYTCNHKETETYIGTHTPGRWVFDVQGNSCATGGKVRLECATCKRYYDEKTVKPGEHVELILDSKSYTHTEVSCYSEIYKCAACNAKVNNNLPHMWIQTQEPIKPDCVLPGLSEAKYCPICFYDSPATVIAPEGHNFRYDENGTKYCTKCNKYDVELDDGSRAECDHFCHNKGIVTKVLAKILVFFWKIFGINQECKCGVPHYVIEEKVK